MTIQSVFKKLLLPVFLFFCPLIISAQQLPFAQLEKQVFVLNNQLKFKESQAILLPLMNDVNLSADYKYHVAVLLSYTYKRLLDYESVLLFLDQAKTFAAKAPNGKKYLSQIAAQKAMAFFDMRRYTEAGLLMDSLSNIGFPFINKEDQGKLIMQQGYMQFLNKNYTASETIYEKAITVLKAVDPCDLPMIYVKQMQLYGAMNRMDLADKSYKKSIVYADSCGIIKYKIYADEELLIIYKHRNDTKNIANTSIELDSLKKIYNTEVNLSALHNQKENMASSINELELSAVNLEKDHLLLYLVILCVISPLLILLLIRFRKQKRKLEAGYFTMKKELEDYLASKPLLLPENKNPDKAKFALLSERQKEIVSDIAKGMANKEIAEKRFISENTVKYHIKNIYQLLEIKDRNGISQRFDI